MTRPHALVVDDEPDIRELVEITLRRMDVETTSAESLSEAIALSARVTVDLCLTDMRLPDGNGIDLVRHMQSHHPTVPVAMITAHGNMDSAIEALKAGAFDFVSKPVDLQVLRNLVQTALRMGERKATPDRTFIGVSAAIERTRATIAKLARSQAPVLISGESGTGKELVARMIHEQGPRAEGPFVPVNCGAIPDDLMESELFGHRKGSFTGAVADKLGLFQASDGGTLFLDEVAELPLHMQVKLLRAIQEKAVRPVGSEHEVGVDARILSASHRDLGALVEQGRFRQDLYYRLNVINLHVPPLRERTEDVPLLADHVLHRLAADTGVSCPELTPEALEALRAHPFPGNVRELENVLERALTLCEGTRLDVDDLGLPEGLAAVPATTRPVEIASVGIASVGASGVGASGVGASGVGASGGAGLGDVIDTLTKDAIVQALERTEGNKRAAARLLGIGFGKLRYQMQKHGLD
jgi:two-component system response regulator PilR (NtrC family)